MTPPSVWRALLPWLAPCRGTTCIVAASFWVSSGIELQSALDSAGGNAQDELIRLPIGIFQCQIAGAALT